MQVMAHLAAGRAQGAIGGNGNCVDVAAVALQVGSEFAVRQVPHLRSTAGCLRPLLCHHLTPLPVNFNRLQGYTT